MKRVIIEKHISDLEYNSLGALSIENRINRISRILRDVLNSKIKKSRS